MNGQSWGYCKKCGGFLVRADNLSYLTSPPQTKLQCKKCDAITFVVETHKYMDTYYKR